MKKLEIYLGISMVLFIIILAITPVGGWVETNPYHNYYINGFTIISINTLISVLLFLYLRDD